MMSLSLPAAFPSLSSKPTDRPAGDGRRKSVCAPLGTVMLEKRDVGLIENELDREIVLAWREKARLPIGSPEKRPRNEKLWIIRPKYSIVLVSTLEVDEPVKV